LRREEVAQLAGLGVTWYTRLEQGQEIGVSTQVLESIARTLQLSPDERNHLFILARAQLPLSPQPATTAVGPALQQVLASLQPNPAYVTNKDWDIVAWNEAAVQVFSDFGAFPADERNLVWLVFLHPPMRQLYVDWPCVAQRTLALFRASAARDGTNPVFARRRDALLRSSPEFRAWWPQYDVDDMHVGRKELNHPRVGYMAFHAMNLLSPDTPDLRIFVYTPLADTDTPQKLAALCPPTHPSR
jgi:transcriptional regulator with XRE-family HTH domain